MIFVIYIYICSMKRFVFFEKFKIKFLSSRGQITVIGFISSADWFFQKNTNLFVDVRILNISIFFLRTYNNHLYIYIYIYIYIYNIYIYIYIIYMCVCVCACVCEIIYLQNQCGANFFLFISVKDQLFI